MNFAYLNTESEVTTMGLFEQLPYTNFHELNLTEMIKRIEELSREMREFKVVNKISYGGDWDITKQYQAWTVVCVNGTEGYISIQPVPNGVNYTNTDYWRLVADFTVQLADLGNRVSTLEVQMTTANGNISNLQTVTNWLRGLLNNSTRKVICISDSYGLTPDVNTSWIVHVKSCLGISDSNFYRSQANGAGFIGLYPAYTFEAQLTTLASAMSTAEKESINDIIIAGGYNDADRLMNGDYTVNQLRSAIGNCLSYARTTFPNANIYVSSISWRINNFNVHSYIRSIENLYTQVAMITERVAYIANVDWMHRQALVDSTGFHPTAICAECIGKSIASVLNGGTVFCDLALDASSGQITPTGTATANVTSLTLNNVRQFYKNGYGTMTWQSIGFTPTVNVGALGEIAILDFTDGIFQGGVNFADAVCIPCIAQVSGVTRKATLLIHENRLYFGNGEQSQINANTPINIIYGGGIGSIMI